MGLYLNSRRGYTLYQNIAGSNYFVDKTKILTELIPLMNTSANCICITRPRRFGKTVMANMIAAFLSKGADSAGIFDKLAIAQSELYHEHLNAHNVIFIDFSRVSSGCSSYSHYIGQIKDKLTKDLLAEFSDGEIDRNQDVLDILTEVFEYDGNVKFTFILDEWDAPFHMKFMTDADKYNYLLFLKNLIKDQPYVEFAYMTGILPIAKYSSGSELNMFIEYTMTNQHKFSDYFGFTQSEVGALYAEFLQKTERPNFTLEELRDWYNGYLTASGARVYNPRSVVAAFNNNKIGSYWTSSGPYDEIFYYIRHNIADVRDDLALMTAGEAVPARVQEYAAVSQNLTTKDEIFSAMVVYGFLSYDKGRVFIPNQELMDKFHDMLRKEQSLGYIYHLAKKSEQMMAATLAGDTATMSAILEYAHDTEVPMLSYNSETELAAIVNLVYLGARDFYDVRRENKAGKGYVDFIFYPKYDNGADCVILELKINNTADEAIRQIKERNYALRFRGKLGEAPTYTGRILAVGIGYYKEEKRHECKVEVISSE